MVNNQLILDRRVSRLLKLLSGTTIVVNTILLLAAITGFILSGWINDSIISVIPEFADSGKNFVFIISGCILIGSTLAVTGAILMRHLRSIGFLLYSIPAVIVLSLHIISLLQVFTIIQFFAAFWIGVFIFLYAFQLRRMR